MQYGREMVLASGRIARRIGLDQVGKIVLKIAQHRGGGVVRIGDKTEIHDFLGFFVADELCEGGRMGSFVKEMASKFSWRKSCSRLVHDLFVALYISAYKLWLFCGREFWTISWLLLDLHATNGQRRR